MTTVIKRLKHGAGPFGSCLAAALLLSTLAGCAASSRTGTLALGHFYDGEYADTLSVMTRTAASSQIPLADSLAHMARASELWNSRKNPFMSKLPSMSGMAIESVASSETPSPGSLEMPDGLLEPDSPENDGASDTVRNAPSAGESVGTPSPSPSSSGGGVSPASSPAAQSGNQDFQVVGIVQHPQRPMAIFSTPSGASQTVQRGDTLGGGRTSQRVAAIHKEWVDLVDVSNPQRHHRAPLQSLAGASVANSTPNLENKETSAD